MAKNKITNIDDDLYTSTITTNSIGSSNIFASYTIPSYNGASRNYINSAGTFVTPSVMTLKDPATSIEIVRLERDGSVVWNKDIDIDEAAEAFSKSIQIGAEISSGITKKVKCEMRDSVFNDLIDIARSKGPLSADDLTYLLEASKIVEK